MAEDKKEREESQKLKKEQLRSVMGRFHSSMYDGVWNTRERLLELNFRTLRLMAHKDVIINGIIKKRQDQVKAFLRPTSSLDDRGFRIVHRDTKEVDDRAKELVKFFLDTGFGYREEREDDLMDFTDMLVRDTYSIDQIAIEIVRTKKGNVFDFFYLDGATVKRIKDDSQEYRDGYRYLQELDIEYDLDKIYFTKDDLVFDYMNKRSDIRYRGYGYSATEMSIDLVTTFLFAMSYNRDQFIKDKIPRGFLKIMGEANPSTVSFVQKYWQQQMSGYGARWKIPVIPSGKDGVGIDFQRLQDSNRDMEYFQLLNIVMALKAMPFGIDLMELGLKTPSTGGNPSPMASSTAEFETLHSMTDGLNALLMFIGNVYNKVLAKVDQKYIFEWVGMVGNDKDKHLGITRKKIESHMTINEVRREEGLDDIEEDYANVVLNPQAVQIYNASKAMEMQQGMGGGGAEEGGDEESGPDEEGYSQDEYTDEDLFGDEDEPIKKSKERYII